MKGSRFYTPAIGIRFSDWVRMLRRVPKSRIAPKYWLRIAGTSLISLICWPFQQYEDWRLRRKLKALKLHDEPVFIIGHWRSGTTHLHNILSKDEQFGYVTTLQGIFPHNYQTNPIFPVVMGWVMPPTRPMDKMKIYRHSPQEEEIALVAYGDYSLYNYWHFPHQMREMYQRVVAFQDRTEAERLDWEAKYMDLLSKAAIYAEKERLLLKNPANTARIPTLLKLFPKARFIHIYRDPMEVYGSTKKLHAKVWPLYNLQDVDPERVSKDIVYVYRELMTTYLRDSELIPEGQLVEVAYPDLVSNPMQELQRIYNTLGLGDFEQVKPAFKAYVDQKKGYVKSEYNYRPDELDMLEDQLGFALERWSTEEQLG